MSRLILVSNRLPVTIKTEGDKVEMVPSSGGLATGLKGHHDASQGLWVGWPGDVSGLTEEQHADLKKQFEKERIVPVNLTGDEIARYYENFSNRILWPLFHLMIDRLPQQTQDWDVYKTVNQRFADEVISHYQPGDVIWVHDIHLMLLPNMLRQKLPEASIGFFLHIPFPPPDVFRALPWRSEILEGVLGSDLIGFHTLAYARHFANTLLELNGIDTENDAALIGGRNVRLGTFPIGVDANDFNKTSQDPEVIEELQKIMASAHRQQLLLGVERLDYTKGISRRLLAIDRLLEKEPEFKGKIRFIQLAVPSRESIYDYAKLRRQVDELVGRINGKHGDTNSVPIHYLYRSISKTQLIALYRAADVMVVTPLRDGMNLVAKEFVASRSDEDGVLVLSEFAGASQELNDAMIVNPYDVDGMADAIAKALRMPEAERRVRMRGLRYRVFDYDIHRWSESFLESLKSASENRLPTELRYSSQEAIDAITQRIRAATRVTLVLDYDGTLVPFAKSAALAVPDNELLQLLKDLSAKPGISVRIVSGRPREFLEKHFKDLNIDLFGEHGFWSRSPKAPDWAALKSSLWEWKQPVNQVMAKFARKIPGSWIEEKTATLGWHYRGVDAHQSERHANNLVAALEPIVRDFDIELLRGNKIIEVRPKDIHKGRVVGTDDSLWVAIGDDRTDEDMFAHLPPDSIGIHVGSGRSGAPYRLLGPSAVVQFLKTLV